MIELLLEAERARSSGQVERAEQLYRQVAQADPHNAIAVVGLALLALDRGNDLGAYLLARRALTIDPEDEAARRLAARLEDGLAARGTPVADPTSRATPVPIASVASPEATARPTATAVAPPLGPAPGPGPGPDPSAGTVRPSGDLPPAVPPVAPPAVAPAVVPKRRRSVLDRLLGRRR